MADGVVTEVVGVVRVSHYTVYLLAVLLSIFIISLLSRWYDRSSEHLESSACLPRGDTAIACLGCGG